MTYLNPACAALIYNNEPPILNCSTEKQIEDTILNNLDREALRELGERARDWVLANHGYRTEHGRICL